MKGRNFHDFTRILLKKVGGTYLSLIFLRCAYIPTVQKKIERCAVTTSLTRQRLFSKNILADKPIPAERGRDGFIGQDIYLGKPTVGQRSIFLNGRYINRGQR